MSEGDSSGRSHDIEEGAARAALRGAFLVIGDARRQDRLRDEQAAPALLRELGVPEAVRPSFLQLVERAEALRTRDEDVDLPDEGKASRVTWRTPAGRTREPDIGKILLKSFSHIQSSFVVSITMSAVLFAIGVALLTIAVLNAFRQGEADSATFTIAGMALADFVLLFYTRPWKDVSSNLSNTQQVRMVAISYLTGLTLLQRGDEAKLETLEHLTKDCVRLLDEYAEGLPPGGRSAEPADTGAHRWLRGVARLRRGGSGAPAGEPNAASPPDPGEASGRE